MSASRRSRPTAPASAAEDEDVEMQEDEEEEEEEDAANNSADIYEEIDEETEPEKEKQSKAPTFLKFKPKEKKETTTPKSLSQTGPKKNPFMIGSQSTPRAAQGTSVFDSMQRKETKVKSPAVAEPKGKGRTPASQNKKKVRNIFERRCLLT